MSLHRTAAFLAFITAACIFSTISAHAQISNALTREVYLNIGGNSIPELTNNPAYPNSPNIQEILTTSWDVPQNAFESYGTRLRALIVPPTTGNYTFWISGDDNCQLFLSTDANPANRAIIARVNAWTSWKEWTKETNQQSAPIPLVGGQQYYLEALQKEGGGGDSLTVRWQLPGGAIEEPLPATRCITLGVAAPLLTQQPTNVTVIEGNQTTFAVRYTQSWGAGIQWRRNGANLPGETGTNLLYGPVSLSDSGAVFSAVVANPFGSTITTNARLSVIPDSTPPTVSSVGNLGDNDVITVVFSEPVEAATALLSGNYSINNGINVLNATFGVDTRTIVLTTSPLTANVTYTLTVNNVRDRAQTPNTIAPNTQRTFTINTRPLDISFLRPGPEVPGPSTRRGPLIISEVMYHPTNRTDLRNIEFIEIFNSNPWFEEMGGYRISGAIDYTFPSNFVLQGRSYVVVAAVPTDVQAVYGITGVLGPWSGALENSEGTLRLRNKQDAILFEMDYTGETPFPASADGAGHSLVLSRPSYGEADPRAWSASDVIGGTPRTNEVLSANPYRSVMINEILAHTDLPDVDYIELFNYSTVAVNIGNCVLTDDPMTNKFVIPAGTTIPANGFLVFNETQLGFALSAAGETVYFKNPQNTRVIDAVRFDAQENGVATGRAPDGSPNFYRLQSKTPGASNSRQRAPIVVINELMYDPISDNDLDEFIELHNPNSNAVNVSRWRIRGGVSFNIPNGTTIPANGYLVVAANGARLRANYPNLNFVNCLGDWDGSLKNRGERLTLSMPDSIVTTNGLGFPVTNNIHIVVDEMTYADGGRWGKFSAGGGSSLELRDARADRRLAPNWGDSIETTKQGWVNVEATGTMDHGWENATQLHITLQGAGEALIDSIELIGPTLGGTNLIGNGSFEGGTTGWVFQGNHNATSWEANEGYLSPRSLHLRADGRGDSGANRVRYQLPFTVPANTANVTLRAKVRWLKGNPNILLRMRGNYHEAPGYVLTVKNLGTPGLPNSIRTTNAGPAITDVAHWPPLPAANVPVLVTARAHDPDGLASMLLSYRIDPTTNYSTVSMTNNGAGVYSAVIPGQISGTTVAFYLQSADKLAPALGATFPNNAPVRECVVRWGDTAVGGVGLGTYRFWITQKVIDQWTAEERMSNKPKDVTYIYGTNRIVYNAGAWFHGSPYHSPAYNSPVGNLCDYDMGFPQDDRLYGETDINLFRPGNGGGDGTAQTEVHAYWFGGQFGAPFLYHRPVFMYVNGALRGIHHDAQQPNGDFVEQWYPDDTDGELHKIQIGFEFGDTAYGNGESGFAGVGANFGRYLTVGGAFKQGRYRATLPWRSASPDEQYDYTNIYALVNNTLTTAPINSEAYTTVLTNTFDVREWYQTHVVQHLIVNNDSFSYGGGQNAFMYKPSREKWKLFLWDVDFAFGGSASDANFFGIGGADHGPRNDHAPFNRIYWQTLMEAANGMMTPARSDTILDARYNGMIANGASVGSPSGIKSHIATRRATLLAQIAAANTSTFEIQSNGGADFSTGNNLVTLTGRAPFQVDRIEVNGVAYNVTWTTTTNWSLRVALPAGTNALSVVGYDRFGTAVAGATDTISVNVTAPGAPPQDNLVINEIMFHPSVADAEYIELFNLSFAVSFDISGWRLDGLDYVFPDGFIIQPRAFILIAKDAFAFAQAYGTNVVPHGVFNGNLQANGETITFVKPGLTAATDQVIDKVRYEGARPWTTNATDTGASIQLIDATKDNTRPGNWWAASHPPIYSPEVSTPEGVRDGWRFFSASGSIGSGEAGMVNTFRLLFYLGEVGSALIDDLTLVSGTTPEVGPNYIRNGNFETPLDTEVTNSWKIGTNGYGDTHLVSDLVHSGTGAMKIVGTNAAGAVNPPFYNRTIMQVISPVSAEGSPAANSVNTLSFWYWATNSATNLYMRIRNSTALNTSPLSGPTNINIFFTPSNYVPPQLISPGTNTLTPGAANQGTATISPIPPLWLNEVLAENMTGILDNNSQREPWVELYNSGTNTVVLTNLFLSDNYTNLTQWAFPPNATIGPGQFRIIFCDGQPGQSTSNEWHTSFRLPIGAGQIAMSRIWNGTTQTLDYLNYAAAPDHSYGEFTDGQLFTRQEFFFVTPGATNNGTLPPVNVVINEWMADNVTAIFDPADGNYEDWFELYNNSSNTVSLAGYFLTDVLTNKTKFEIPPGITIPPYGYLLVWADDEAEQNAFFTGDLHVNFSLAKSGDSIGLFTPDGIQIDAFSFLGQITDVTTGRFPDGANELHFLFDYTPRAANYLPQPNVAPELAPIANRTVFEGEVLAFTATATDSNLPAQTLTWTLLPGAPAGAIISSNTGAFGWVPSEAQGGNAFNLSVRVSDSGNPPLSATQSFSVTVLKTNSAPSLAIGGGRTVNEGDTITFNAIGTDGDVPTQTLTYVLDATSLALGASINANNGTFSWTPNETHGPGAYTMTISVLDSGTPALSNAALVTITVNESNTPPVLTAIPNRTAALGEVVSFTATAIDSDLPAQLVTFDFAVPPPAGATVNSTNGLFTWTANTVGTNTFTLRATDNGPGAYVDTKVFEVVVTSSELTTSIGISNQVVLLRWNAISNRTYHVEFKNDLSETNWTPLVTNIVATGETGQASDAISTNTQRLYRIVLEP
jgi:hypothetical protein